MMSASARANRRGGMSEREFMRAMHDAGFRHIPPGDGELWAWTNVATGTQRYAMPRGDRYSAVLPRMLEQLLQFKAAA